MTPRALAPALVGAGATLVLLVGGGVVHLERSDRSTSFGEDAAVAAFRSAAPPAQPAATQRPRDAAAAPAVAGTGAPAAAPTAGPAREAVTASGGAASPPAPARPTAAAAPRRSSAPPATAPAARPGAAGGSARREVEPGVYRYATSGHEEVDALGGARHDYPASTTVTYTRTGCGTEERWQPLQERFGVAQQCAGPAGTELRSTVQSREFFGRRETRTYRCDPGVLLLPADPRPGQTWSGRCTEQGSAVRLDGQVVGLQRLDVGGSSVEVVHVRLDGTVTGSVRGSADREVWLARDTGLLVQAVGETDTDADTAGGTVHYRESYRLRLTSLSPRR